MMFMLFLGFALVVSQVDVNASEKTYSLWRAYIGLEKGRLREWTSKRQGEKVRTSREPSTSQLRHLSPEDGVCFSETLASTYETIHQTPKQNQHYVSGSLRPTSRSS
jgi:hypothetical protein